MKVLITGAEGYIGALLAPVLLQRGHEVEELSTHRGSLIAFARHVDDSTKCAGCRAMELIAKEESAGFAHLENYLSFAKKGYGDEVQDLGFSNYG